MRREYDDKDINRNLRNTNIDSSIENDNISDNQVPDIKEWDINDDEEIQEFLSRDFDVVSESRRRLQNRQNGSKRSRSTNEQKSANTRKINKNEKVNLDKKGIRKERSSKVGAMDDNSADVVKKSGLYEKWLDIYHAHTMQLLFGALTVLIAILIVAIVVTYSDSDSSDNIEQTTSFVNETSTDNTETNDPAIQPEAEGSDIHTLIVGYIDAAYIKADMEAVALVVDDTTNINVDKYKSRQKYIELYENIKCYKFESAIENAFIVFVTYDTKLYNIETLAPSAETFIVKYSETDKKYVIHNLTVEEELDSYIAGASKFAYTSEIRADIEKRLKEALASDAELKKVYDLMISTGSKATEEATSSTAIEDKAAEQTTTAVTP